MNLVFTNQNKEDFYPLTTREIVEAQQEDNGLNKRADKEGFSTQLVKIIKELCKEGKMVIQNSLQHHAVAC